MPTTAEIMTPNPIVARTDTTLGEVAGRMLRHRIRHVPVVDDAGRATHVVTDVAVFRYGGPTGEDMELWVPFQEGDAPITVSQILEPVQVVVPEGQDATVTLRRMVDADQDFALVVDDAGALTGIVTEHDGLRVAAEVLDGRDLTTRIEISSPVLVARRADPAAKILAVMQERGIRHMPVVDAAGVAVGVISAGDLLADSAMHQPELTVADVMRANPLRTIGPDRPLAEAAATMLAEHIGCLPVVDAHGVPRGILTRLDLVESAVVALEDEGAFPAPD